METDDKGVLNLQLGSLILRCREATANYRQQEPASTAYCFEIWRRAFEARDHAAWEALYNIYQPQVRNWVRRTASRWPAVKFDEEALVNGVFIRAFRFISPEKFGSFNSLARLLEYLKLCSTTEVLDTMRQYEAASRDVPLEKGGEENGPEVNPGYQLASTENVEDSAGASADRARFWEMVEKVIPEMPYRVAVYSRFVLQMPPREIAEVYSQYYVNSNDVHRCLKNALWRCRQDPALRKWFQDLRD